MLRELWFNLKMRVQRFWRGYADDDIWNLDHTIISFVGPRVEVLRKACHGYPAEEGMSAEKWDQILSDIVYFCKTYTENNEDYLVDPESDFYRKYRYTGDLPSPDECIRARRGFEYFKQYLLSLWD